jgi:hypothetical protein
MKRSAQVALVLMGATTVGAGSYALAPRTECVPPGSAASRPAVAPGTPGQPGEPCRETRRWGSSSGSGGYAGGSGWRRSTHVNTSSPLHSPGGSISSSGHTSTPSSVPRGGFGSTGRGFSFGG